MPWCYARLYINLKIFVVYKTEWHLIKIKNGCVPLYYSLVTSLVHSCLSLLICEILWREGGIRFNFIYQMGEGPKLMLLLL